MTTRVSARTSISPRFIAQVCERLAAGKPVRRALPGKGRLHIDRALPFLCVYRERAAEQVGHTSQLVIGEAAHLIVPGTAELHDGVCALVAGIAAVMIEEFGAFLLLEVWTAESPEVRTGTKAVPVSTFRIVAPMLDHEDATIRQLHKALSLIPLRPPPLDVELAADAVPSPPSLPPLVPTRSLQSASATRADSGSKSVRSGAAIAGLNYVGVEVQPIYRQARTGTPYPVLFETLRCGLSLALRQSAYHFAMLHTGHKPTHYHALGRRTAVQAASDADKELSEIPPHRRGGGDRNALVRDDDASVAPVAAFGNRPHVARMIVCKRITWRLSMPQVVCYRRELEVSPPDAAVDESRGELTVFASPSFKRFVVSVHRHQVITPERHVAASGATVRVARTAHESRKHR